MTHTYLRLVIFLVCFSNVNLAKEG